MLNIKLKDIKFDISKFDASACLIISVQQCLFNKNNSMYPADTYIKRLNDLFFYSLYFINMFSRVDWSTMDLFERAFLNYALTM
jgi:hypothetical protein